MRVLTAIILALLLGWGGYWFVGSAALEGRINAWFGAEVAAGADAGRKAVSVLGFPTRFDVTVTSPHLRDPASGWGWKAPVVKVMAKAWEPWRLVATLPHEQTIDAPDGEVLTLRASRLTGSLLVRPDLTLALNRVLLDGETLALSSSAGWRWTARKLVVTADEDKSAKNAVRLDLSASALRPDAAVVAKVPGLGPVISDSHLDATLRLTAPVNRKLATAGAHVTAVDLNAAHMAWGPLSISARGSLKRGADGRAQGEVKLTLVDWKRLPGALVALGIVPPSGRALVVRALTVFAGAAGNPRRLTLPLVMNGGWMTLDHLPIGLAPMLP